MDAEISARTITYEGRPAALTLVRDITERKRLMREYLEERNLARFLNDIMSHDISNFNQAALGCLNFLERLHPKLDEESRNYLEGCRRQIQHTTQLIARIREFVDIRSMSTTNFIRMDLSSVISKVIRQVRESHPEISLNVRFRPVPGRFVRANALIDALFLNLLNNAVQHNTSDKKVIWVGIRAHRLEGEKHWKVHVSDNGKGIPGDMKKRIFDRFRQQGSAGRTGMGLFIVNELVGKFGGSIRVEDRVPGDPAKGATFVMLFPAD